jgi:methyltransferase (TIGR00027 family)
VIVSHSAAIQSAETVAALRAAAANETALTFACGDRFAKHFVGPRQRLLTGAPQSLVRWALERAAPGSYGYIIARTRCFDEALLAETADGIQQVVILGAGYDSRALRFRRELKDVHVFEVDHPGTQMRKLAMLSRAGRDLPKDVHYVPVDFNLGSLDSELAKDGFSRSRRTLFLWEGVSYYLPRSVVAQILRFVSSCASGSSIIFDYALQQFVGGNTSTYGGEHIARWLRKIGEPFVFGLDPHEAPKFLAECGLQSIYDIGPEDAESRYLKRKDGSLFGRTLGHVRIVHACNRAGGARRTDEIEELTVMTSATVQIGGAALSAPAARRKFGKDTDWAGLWFDIMEKEAGEFVGMRAGRRSPGTEELTWIFHSHAAHDGIGWFASLLRGQAPASKFSMPRLRECVRPSLLAQVNALLQLLARRPQAAAKWNTWDARWQAPAGGAKAGTAVAVHAFDAHRTHRLAEAASAQGVSLNSLLLATLGRVSEPQLQGGPAFWMVPVNMRGPVTLGSETANHTSYLQIKTGADVTPRQLHERVKEKLFRLEHWGSWLFANSGQVVRYRGMKWLYCRELARTKGRPWVGSFSNLGTWNDCDQWFVCPPVAQVCPLGVGVVICNGALLLTMDAHPSIAQDAAWTRTLMDRLVCELARLAA